MRASAEVFDHVAHNGLYALDGPGQTALALLLAIQHHAVRLGQVDVDHLVPVGRTMASPTVFWMVSRSNTFSYWADRVALSLCSLVIWLRREATSPLSTVYCTWLNSSSAAKSLRVHGCWG